MKSKFTVISAESDELQKIKNEHKAAVKEAADLRKTLELAQKNAQVYHVESPHKDNTFTLGVITDTHFGSLYTEFNTVKALMRTFQAAKVDLVAHSGDVLDGHGIYKGQEFEQSAHGFEEQLNFGLPLSEIYTGPVTFITGNHDESFKKLSGLNAGLRIQEAYGWKFMGPESGTIEVHTRNKRSYSIQAIHPGGGSAYALSYRIQKIVDQLEGGTKSNCLISGHFHKAEMIPSYRNVCCIQGGCTQWQTPFMMTKGLAAHVGGWIIRITVSDRKLLFNRVQGEFISLYRPQR